MKKTTDDYLHIKVARDVVFALGTPIHNYIHSIYKFEVNMLNVSFKIKHAPDKTMTEGLADKAGLYLT